MTAGEVRNPLFEGKVVAIPTWLCPKCGAVCDVEFQAPLDPQQRAYFEEVKEYWELTHEERKKHPLHGSLIGYVSLGHRDMSDRALLPPDGRLIVRCTRCTHVYFDKPLDVS